MRIGQLGSLLAAIAPALCFAQVPGEPTHEIFPMKAGTRWIYRGEVAWQEINGTQVSKAILTWTMRVVDSFESGRYTVALLSGHPRDLTWYERGRNPGCYFLIRVDGSRYYLRECAATDSRERLHLRPGDLPKLVDDDLIIKLPLHKGDVFGRDDEDKRQDTMYGWLVSSIGPARLGLVMGAVPRPRTPYVLTYRTNPDNLTETYDPGIGLTSFDYSHNGTTSEVHVKLVDFHSPVR
jgi:hypothetical protein